MVLLPYSRTNRKDLNKFLGLDDSDSEEMVFISNRKRPSAGEQQNQQYQQQQQHQSMQRDHGHLLTSAAPAPNDNSLNRSEQGSSGSSGVVSVVGIRFVATLEKDISGFKFLANFSQDRFG